MAIATLVQRIGDLQVHAGEVLLGDEVHDTGDGVGTVGGHGSAGQRVNALDEGQRDIVQIDNAAKAGRGQALTVEQDEVAVGAEAAKIDEAGAAVAVVHGRTDARHEAGDFTQHFFGHVAAAQRDGVSRGGGDRHGRHQVRVADQGTGNNDDAFFGSFSLSSGSGRLSERRAGHQGESQRGDAGRQREAPMRIVELRHGMFLLLTKFQRNHASPRKYPPPFGGSLFPSRCH